jgi:hypothetical protein
MNENPKVFFCFILPGGDIFPCSGNNGEVDFPWTEAMNFIETARSVFSSHQIDNAAGYLSCDEIIKKFENGERDLKFMYEVASYVSGLRKRWHMD